MCGPADNTYWLTHDDEVERDTFRNRIATTKAVKAEKLAQVKKDVDLIEGLLADAPALEEV